MLLPVCNRQLCTVPSLVKDHKTVEAQIKIYSLYVWICVRLATIHQELVQTEALQVDKVEWKAKWITTNFNLITYSQINNVN